jgi:hypothetical protein
MGDVCIYRIEVSDLVDEYAFNAMSPQQIKVVQAEKEITLFTIHTDQSGLIGLLRQLHGQGVTLLSITRNQ